MKINIAYAEKGSQKQFEIDDEKKLAFLYEKQIRQDVPMDQLGEQFTGYVCKITGGNDKQGFPMKLGVMTTNRVRLLLKKGQSCYRPRRKGERKRKSVRGCQISSDISVLNMTIVRRGEKEIPGLTDRECLKRLGPKRASKIRGLYGLTNKDDPRQYVIRRMVGKNSKAPKIQRLVTDQRRRRKRKVKALKKQKHIRRKELAEEFHQKSKNKGKEKEQ